VHDRTVLSGSSAVVGPKGGIRLERSLDLLPTGEIASRIIELRRLPMRVRVVRFTDVTAERMQELVARVRDAGGAPPGVNSTGLEVLFDEAQGTAVVLQHFATAEDLDAGARVFAAMDPGETPGTRVSVDACEVKLRIGSPG